MRQGIGPAVCLALALVAAAGVAADGAGAQLASQARYWEQKGRYDLAREAWLKLLRAEPNNTTALVGLAAAEIRGGRPELAQPYLQTLRQVQPDSAELRRLEGMVATGALGDDQLKRARELARAGRNEEAIVEYRRVFGGQAPEGPLALEYWQTLGGTSDGWQDAAFGLRKLVDSNPDNADYRLALAQHLTYREETRREGIQQLMKLAETDSGRQPVQPSWRQALLWLGGQAGDAKYFQAYLKRYGDDTQVSSKLAAGRSGGGVDVAGGGRGAPARVDVRGRELKRAWDLLNAGKVAESESAFNALRKRNAKDADALAGLGIIRLRQDRFGESRELLTQASKIAPGRAGQWASALAAAKFWEQVRLADADRSAGDLPAAERRLRTAIAAAPTIAAREPSVRISLGDIVMAQDRANEAEALYRDVLRREPGNLDASRGLMTALAATNRNAEALALYASLTPAQQEAIGTVSSIQAKALRQQAAQAVASGDEVGAERLLREALATDPQSTWPRLDLARLYLSQSRPKEARSLIDGLPTSGPQRGEASYIRALMAAEEQHWYDGLMWLEQVPEAERTADMGSVQKRLWVRYQTERAAVYARQGYREEALALLSGVEPYAVRSPELLGAVSLAYTEAGEQGRGLYLVRNALSRNPEPDPDLRLAYAGMLLKLGQTAEFDAVMDQMARLPILSPRQEGAFTEMRITQRLRQADEVRQTGNVARAYDLLEPVLRANPEDPRLIMALARLYDQAGEYERSASLYKYAVKVEPRNLDAYQGAVQANLALGNENEADRWLAEAFRLAPDSGRLHVLAGRMAKARGQDGRALALFQRALELGPGSDGAARGGALRLQMLDAHLRAVALGDVPLAAARKVADRGDRVLVQPTRFAQGSLIKVATQTKTKKKKAKTKTRSAASAGTPGVALAGADGLPLLLPPGYKLPTPAESGSSLRLDTPRNFIPPPLGPSPLSLRLDPTLRSRDYAYEEPAVADTPTGDVLREIASLTSQRSAWVAGGLSLRNRDGTAGLDRLDDIELPLEASLASVDAGRFTFRVVPVYLDAGTVSGSNLPFFGTLAELPVFGLDPAGRTVEQNDEGAAVGVAYEAGKLQLDFGSSPLGFEIVNLVGGIRWKPQFGPWVVDADLSRRAVTDSVLSYAGARDPLTDEQWGGVTSTGGRLEVAYDFGDVGLYASGGFHVYDGKNVASNNQTELGGGAYLKLRKTDISQLTVGVNLTTFYFDENLRRFTLGHGGYFSPQRYVALTLPAEWSGGHNRYSWRLNAAIGMQNFREDGAALYPDDKRRQERLEQFAEIAATDDPPTIIATGYEGQSSNGMGLSFGGQFEYLIAPRLVFGALGAFDNARDYDESRVMAYLRYAVSSPQAISVPPRPVLPFSDFGRR